MSCPRIPKFLLVATVVIGTVDRPHAVADVSPTDIDERVVPLVPKRVRREAEDDRLTAAARYAHGRILLRRGDRHAALRSFQRAWRYDPNSISIIGEIVPLAGTLERRAEAARYAVLAAERYPSDAELLRQLGSLLVQQNDLPRAVRMYEHAVKLEEAQPPVMATVVLRMEMGRLYFILGDFPKAAEAFAYVRDALKFPGKFGLTPSQRDRLLKKSALLYQVIGESFLLTDRFADAVEAFENAHEASADKAMLEFQLASVHARQQNWDEANQKLDAYFQSKSTTAGQEPYALLRDVLAATETDEKKAAEILLSRLVALHKKDADNSELANFLAGQHLGAKQWEQAEELYRELLDQRPTLSAFQGLTEIYRNLRKTDRMLKVLGRAVEQTGSLEVLGQQRSELVKDTEWLDELTALAKKQGEGENANVGPHILTAVALLAVSSHTPETAEWFAQRASEASGESKREALETIGLAMYLAGHSEPAARLLRQAIEGNPSPKKTAADFYYLAGALEMAGKTDEALEAAREAAKLQPDSAPLHARVPWVLFHAQRYADAEREYLRLLQEFDSYYESSSVRETVREARIMLSNICVLQERIPEAEEYLEQVLDEFPENIAAMNDLGYLWADQGRHLERAHRMVELAVQADPENAAYRDSLGWALFRLGNYQESIQELERAAAKKPPDGVILDHLGDAYLQAKKRDKAITTWRQAIDVFREQQDTDQQQATEAKIRAAEAE